MDAAVPMSSLLSRTRLCAPLHYVGKTARDVNARAAGAGAATAAADPDAISAEADAIPAVPAVTPDGGRGYAIGPATTTTKTGEVPPLPPLPLGAAPAAPPALKGIELGLPARIAAVSSGYDNAEIARSARRLRQGGPGSAAFTGLHAKVALPINAAACSREWSIRLLLAAGRSLPARREIGSLTCRFAP